MKRILRLAVGLIFLVSLVITAGSCQSTSDKSTGDQESPNSSVSAQNKSKSGTATKPAANNSKTTTSGQIEAGNESSSQKAAPQSKQTIKSVLPVYPGAKLTSKNSQTPSEGEKIETLRFEATDKLDSVIVWYQKQMPGKGWQETENREDPDYSWYTEYTNKNQDEAVIELYKDGYVIDIKLYTQTFGTSETAEDINSETETESDTEAEISTGEDVAEPEASLPESVNGQDLPVSLELSSKKVSSGEEFTVDLKVGSAGWGVSGVEFDLNFDPDALEIKEIKAGDLLGSNPLEGAKKIDNSAGTATYALARVGETAAQSEGGTLASITFKARSSTGQPVKITISRLNLTDENFADVTGLPAPEAEVTVK
jgi:hypothetical protein